MKNINLDDVFWKAIGITLVAPFVGAAIVRVIDTTKDVIKAVKR